MTLRRDLSELSKELQLAGIAAVALALSLLLPWYQQSVVRGRGFVQTDLSAFQVFTPVEAAGRQCEDFAAKRQLRSGHLGTARCDGR